MLILLIIKKRVTLMKYPAIFKKTKKGYVVKFRNIPEAITQGETLAEAIEMAEDALITALSFYFEDRRKIPAPSPPKASERLISLPLSVSIKVELLNLIIDKEVSNSALAKLMGVWPQQVARIVDLNHITKIDTLEAAFNALGRELVISLASIEK